MHFQQFSAALAVAEFAAGDFVVDEIKRERFFAQLREWREQGWSVFVYCNNEGETEKMTAFVREYIAKTMKLRKAA